MERETGRRQAQGEGQVKVTVMLPPAGELPAATREA